MSVCLSACVPACLRACACAWHAWHAWQQELSGHIAELFQWNRPGVVRSLADLLARTGEGQAQFVKALCKALNLSAPQEHPRLVGLSTIVQVANPPLSELSLRRCPNCLFAIVRIVSSPLFELSFRHCSHCCLLAHTSLAQVFFVCDILI